MKSKLPSARRVIWVLSQLPPAVNCANTSIRGGSKPSRAREHVEIAAAPDRAVAGLDRDVLRRQRVRQEPAGPQVTDAIAPVRGAERGEPDERARREHREHRGRAHVQRGHFEQDGILRAYFSASSASSGRNGVGFSARVRPS